MLKKGLETSYEDSNRCKHSKPAVDIQPMITVRMCGHKIQIQNL